MRTGLSVQVKLLPTSSQPNAAAGRSRFTSTNVCDVPDFHSSVSTTIPTLCIQATTIHVFPLSLPQDSTFFPSHAKMKVRLSNLKSKSSFQVLIPFLLRVHISFCFITFDCVHFCGQLTTYLQYYLDSFTLGQDTFVDTAQLQLPADFSLTYSPPHYRQPDPLDRIDFGRLPHFNLLIYHQSWNAVMPCTFFWAVSSLMALYG